MDDGPSTRSRRGINLASGTPVQTSAAGDLLSQFTSLAVSAASTASKLTLKGVDIASGVVFSTADAVGLKDKVEAVDYMARKLAARGRSDANKAVNKARRMATRALDLNDGDSFVACYDYDMLLSAPGAVEKRIPPLGKLSPTFTLPPNSALVYKIRIKKWDIGFSIREVIDTHTPPIVLEPLVRYGCESVISGVIPAESGETTRTIHFVFDNSHAPLQSKSLVFWVAIGENASLEDDHSDGERSKEVSAAEEGPALD